MADPVIEGRACYWGGFRPTACQYSGHDRELWMTGYEFAKAHYEASRQRMIYAATSKSRIRPRILSALSDGPMTMRQLSIVLTVRFDSINQQIVLLLRDGLIRRMGTTLPDAVDGKTRQLFGLLADA